MLIFFDFLPMLPVYLGIYIFLLAILWAFFLVARHHTFRFKDFSTNIQPVTQILGVILIILSLLGFVLIFTLDDVSKNIEIDTQKPSSNFYY